MTLQRIMPAHMTPADLENLKRACESSYAGYGTNDILEGVLALGLQLWRWGESEGVVVTRIEQLPAGKQLFVLMLAGRGFRQGLDGLWQSIFSFARQEHCSWVAGVTDQQKLIEAYEAQQPAKNYHYMVFAVEAQKGLADWTEVEVPGGTKLIGDLRVGDVVCGSGRRQRVTAVHAAVSGRVLADGLAPGTLVRDDGESWRTAADIAPGATFPATIIEITVEPSHEFRLADGRIVHNKGGGKDTKQTSTTKPWWGQRQPLLNAYERADEAYKQTQGFDAPSAQDVVSAQAGAAEGADTGADVLRQNALATARGDYMQAGSNPYLQGQVDAALGSLNRNFQQNVLPSIQDSASQLGAYGGSRQGIAEARAMDDLNRTAGNVAGSMYYNNYAQERVNQLNAAQQFLGANQIALQPGLMLNDAYTSSQTLPFLGAQQYAQIAQGGPVFAQNNTRASGGGQSGTAGFLQGAAGGASAGAAIGSVVPGIGTGIGAGVGGALGGIGSFF